MSIARYGKLNPSTQIPTVSGSPAEILHAIGEMVNDIRLMERQNVDHARILELFAPYRSLFEKVTSYDEFKWYDLPYTSTNITIANLALNVSGITTHTMRHNELITGSHLPKDKTLIVPHNVQRISMGQEAHGTIIHHGRVDLLGSRSSATLINHGIASDIGKNAHNSIIINAPTINAQTEAYSYSQRANMHKRTIASESSNNIVVNYAYDSELRVGNIEDSFVINYGTLSRLAHRSRDNTLLNFGTIKQSSAGSRVVNTGTIKNWDGGLANTIIHAGSRSTNLHFLSDVLLFDILTNKLYKQTIPLTCTEFLYKPALEDLGSRITTYLSAIQQSPADHAKQAHHARSIDWTATRTQLQTYSHELEVMVDETRSTLR